MRQSFLWQQSALLLTSSLSCISGSVVPGWLLDAQHPISQRPGSQSTKGAVACESRVCSQIGLDLLARGGNAVDAYVGTQLCVGVIGMHHSGLGGGGFLVVRDENGNVTAIDFREAAPAAAFEDMYRDNVQGSITGGLAAGVPGELRGMETTHQRFGKLPWRTVVEPSARVARDGFPVTEDQVRYMQYGISSAGRNFLVENPSWAEDFAPTGSLVKLGDTMTRKRYADTLQQVAEHGADVFYKGPMANATIEALRKENGSMTLDDLESYETIIRRPLSIEYRGYRLYTSSAPSSGSVLLSTLKTMEGYDPADSKDVNLSIHRFDEAMRFAYAAHQQIGDPDYVEHDMDAFEDKMLDPKTAAEIRGKILDNTTQPVKHYNSAMEYTAESHGTSHVVATDSSGLAVSGTSTVNLLFGNLIMVPETGVILNNEMNDFSIPNVRNEFGFEPAEANFIRGGKRMLSSITPVIVEHPNGTLFLSVGAAGGSRIISATTQVVWHVLEHGKSMLEAIEEPRLHDQLMPNTVTFEYKFDNDTVQSMQEKGHHVVWVPEGRSAVQGIRRLGDGTFEAVGETRQKNSGGLTF